MMDAEVTYELDDGIPRVIVELPRGMARVRARSLARIRDGARRRAPIGPRINYPSTQRVPGYLRSSIKVEGHAVVVEAFYGGYVEGGTDDTVPQPYLGPAAADEEDRLIHDTADELREITRGRKR